MTETIVDAARQNAGMSALEAAGEPESARRFEIEDLSSLAPGILPQITVVIPTRNEVDSIAPLLERLADSVANVPLEVLFVDDSDDGTADSIRAAARTCGLAIRLLHRPESGRRRGLGSAVVEGLRYARGPWAVVMDADLQHPPELVTRLVAIGESRQLDLVAATRYVEGGASAGLSGGVRKTVSGTTTRLVKTLFPRRLAHISDPMSGFFAARLAALDIDNLKPNGFKILLDVAVREHPLRVAEVPFVFGTRVAGESKASVREGARFVRHVAQLRAAVMRRQITRTSTASRSERLRKLVLFGLVGLSGVGVNEGALWLLNKHLFQHWYLLAAVLATEVSTIWNFALTEKVVFRGPKPGSLIGRGVRFALVNHIALLVRLPLLAFLVEVAGTPLLLGNLVTLAMLFAVRFLIADAAIYAKAEQPGPDGFTKDPIRLVVHAPSFHRVASPDIAHEVVTSSPTAVAARKASRYLPYRYSIDNVLTIGSQVRLRELEYFRSQWVGNDVDLAIRIGPVGRGMPRSRAMMTQYASPPGFAYQEQLGRLGANFRVEIGDPIEVTCSATLAKSPHVLYTNVIEALLRFVAVSRGVVLLHSACLDLDGTGLLLSAKTDTGKTGTVLRMVRDYGARFLSDDMTIVNQSGIATCFPKPLTISHHTLRAIEAGDLSPAEWRRLKLQSRLHSKEGRQFGIMLAGMNIPIMGLNSLTQRIVPPPKYTVDRLIECTIARTTAVSELFVIERGPADVDEIGVEETLRTLVENTDDAYGFPPFKQLAPAILIGESDYAALRTEEQAILGRAMSGVRARRVATDDFTWADRISDLLKPAVTAKHRAKSEQQFGPAVAC